MAENIDDKVRGIVAERLSKDVAEITLDKSFTKDLGADSLDIVELVMAMEETFEIQIPEEEAEKIKTVGDACAFIKNYQPAKTAVQ